MSFSPFSLFYWGFTIIFDFIILIFEKNAKYCTSIDNGYQACKVFVTNKNTTSITKKTNHKTKIIHTEFKSLFMYWLDISWIQILRTPHTLTNPNDVHHSVNFSNTNWISYMNPKHISSQIIFKFYVYIYKKPIYWTF